MPDTARPAPDTANPVLDFLLSRRSRPAAALQGPAPDTALLHTWLTAAARVPDHGKLEPWRFVVVAGDARARLSAALRARGPHVAADPAKVDKTATLWAATPMIVAVISAPKPAEKVPEVEQILSAGAVCLGLVNAALASGWGAVWLTGWAAYDRAFLERDLGLNAHESLAGFIHLGRCDTAVPERPRPDVEALTQWAAP